MRARATLAVAYGDDGAPPTEFRLFTAGWNDTEHGRFLFDKNAAASVMASFSKRGIDVAIDLEHQMLDSEPSPDPTARDARGWCRLELRDDGSLWAVQVRWTPDGAARLSEKRQRYVSPAFELDSETKRVTKIINVAITAIPATHDTPALVAAAARGKESMDPKLIAQALDALIAGDSEKCAELLKSLVAAAAAGTDPDAATEDAPPPAGDGGADEATESAVPPSEDEQEDGPSKTKDKKEMAAASARLMRLTGKDTIVDALDQIETFKASHIALEEERQKLAAERATLESAERRKLCVELITLGAEFPATVWADDKATALKPRWAKLEMASLREHVAEQRAARRTSQTKSAPRTPAVGESAKAFNVEGKVVELSARELATCTEMGVKPEVYAANKIRRETAAA